jgi:hypothetical protein
MVVAGFEPATSVVETIWNLLFLGEFFSFE